MSPTPTNTPISDLPDHLGYWLRLVSNQVSGAFARQLQTVDASVAEWVVLRHLYRVGSANPEELRHTLGVTKGAVSKMVVRLEQRGWVQRVGLDFDGRRHELTLTAAGAHQVPLLAELANANESYFFGHLSARQLAQLTQALQALAKFHQWNQVPIN